MNLDYLRTRHLYSGDLKSSSLLHIILHLCHSAFNSVDHQLKSNKRAPLCAPFTDAPGESDLTSDLLFPLMQRVFKILVLCHF